MSEAGKDAWKMPHNLTLSNTFVVGRRAEQFWTTLNNSISGTNLAGEMAETFWLRILIENSAIPSGRLLEVFGT